MLKNVLSGKVDADLIAKYIVLAGSFCLLRYIENCEGINFAARSIRLDYCNSTNNRLNIDRRSALNLELISNAKTGSQRSSLFGAVNLTKTKVGERYLKSNILRPLTDITTIETRLDVVSIMLQNNRIISNIVSILKQFPDLDKMLSGLTSTPKQVTIL
jgi:DNA mismatch repair protein MSH4